MIRKRVQFITAAALASLAPCAVHLHAGGFPVWVKTSLERVGTSDSPGSVTQANISAAKGETESFQIVVQAPAGGLTNGNVALSDLTGPGGQTISQNNYTLYAERYVYVNPGSVNWNGTNQPLGVGWYPDPLVPFKNPSTGQPLSGTYTAVPFSLSAGTNETIWVDLTVPRTAAAGQYTGTITITSSAGTASVPVSLRVWNFALPVNPSQPSSFGFWTQFRTDWNQVLLQHRVMPDVSSCAGLLSSPGLFAAGCIGNATADQTLMANGQTTADLRFWSGAYYGNCALPPPPSVGMVQQAAASHQPGMVLYNYSVDEAQLCSDHSTLYPSIQQWGNVMHQAGILNMVAMAPVPELLSAIDIWAVQPVTWGPAAANIAAAKQAGDKVWIYDELVQDGFSPKWQIDFAPINFRIVPGFIDQALGVDGIMYSRVDGWTFTLDPWNQVNNMGVYSTNDYPGEETLVYPGDQVGMPGGIVPSMRLKYIRDGMDDYDYITILKGMGLGAWATSVAQSVGPDWTNWTRDINALYNARTTLANMIEQVNSLSSNSGPSVLSAAPVAGSGPSSNFTFTVASGSGASNVGWIDILINTAIDGRNACWIAFNAASRTMWLATDDTSGWNPASIGSGSTLQNSQCSIAASGASVSSNGNLLSLTLPISFTAAFAGQKNVYVITGDNQGRWTGYQQESTWLVIPNGPGIVSATPSGASGSGQTFQFTFSDSNGGSALNSFNVIIGTSTSNVGTCAVSFNPGLNMLFLQWDSAQGANAAMMGDGSYVMSNSQCAVNPGKSSITSSGDLFILNLSVTFPHSYAGVKTMYLQTADSTGSTGYKPAGSYTVQ